MKKQKNIKYLYCCGVDWQEEIGAASDIEGRMPLYTSVEKLKKDKSCWKSCGIVKLKVEFVEWVEKQNLFIYEEEE